MSGVLDLIEGAMEMIAADPSKLLDPEFDMFASVEAAVPEFKEWRERFMAKTVLAEDNVTKHVVGGKLALGEHPRVRRTDAARRGDTLGSPFSGKIPTSAQEPSVTVLDLCQTTVTISIHAPGTALVASTDTR